MYMYVHTRTNSFFYLHIRIYDSPKSSCYLVRCFYPNCTALLFVTAVFGTLGDDASVTIAKYGTNCFFVIRCIFLYSP